MDQYVRTLADPFYPPVQQPKLLDGKVDYSAGIRLRAAGQIICKSDGNATYICILPYVQNSLCWRSADTATQPTPYPSNQGTSTDRGLVQSWRIVGVGAKFSLVNAQLESEGFFEAVRIPYLKGNFVEDSSTYMVDAATGYLESLGTSMPNHSTYMSGKLRDIHRYEFKLNSVDNDHEFVGKASVDLTPMVDRAWDLIVIKITGRVSTVPSVIRYEVICNQEVVYVDGTAAARIMTRSPGMQDVSNYLVKTRYVLPAVQIA